MIKLYWSKAFTLLETMIAIVILSSALLLLANSWSSSFLRVRKTQHQFEVASLLQRKMTEIELEYANKPLTEIPEERSEDFGEKYPQYTWRMTSREVELPDLSSIMVAQSDGTNDFVVSLIKQMTEALSKSLKEVTVTVILTPPKGKAQEYSVTTYFAEYDKDIQMGM